MCDVENFLYLHAFSELPEEIIFAWCAYYNDLWITAWVLETMRTKFYGLAHRKSQNMLNMEEFLDAFNSDQTLLQ